MCVGLRMSGLGLGSCLPSTGPLLACHGQSNQKGVKAQVLHSPPSLSCTQALRSCSFAPPSFSVSLPRFSILLALAGAQIARFLVSCNIVKLHLCLPTVHIYSFHPPTVPTYCVSHIAVAIYTEKNW